MKKLGEIIDIEYLEEGLLYEAGLSRLVTHLSEPFAMLTAFRGNYSLKQNRQRNRELERELKSMKAGGIKLIGHWMESPDGLSWEEAKKQGKVQDVVEESYFVPIPKNMDFEEFKSEIQRIIRKFNQDAAVISNGNAFYLLFKNGKLDKLGNKVSINKVAQAYSTIRGKPKIPFVFEGTMQPSNNMHKIALQKRGVIWFASLTD